MIFDYFKKNFGKKNSLKEECITYEHKPLIKNSHSIYNAYDYNEVDYLLFHQQFLNNDFFLNSKNKEILEKIHEDLQSLIKVFEPLLYQKIGLELVLTGGALRDLY